MRAPYFFYRAELKLRERQDREIRRLNFGAAYAVTIVRTVLFSVVVLVCHMAFAGPMDPVAKGASNSGIESQAEKGSKSAGAQDGNLSKAQAHVESAAGGDLAFSRSALRVIEIARQNGDRHFILIDKSQGKLFLFQNGKLTFGSAALTGESMADQLPPDAISKPVSQHIGVKYKVTPAGRFTLARGHDDTFGETFDINELQGTDWVIAIHQVWLGIRSQHRDARLRSSNDQDKHVTEGCIDVDPSTIAQLSRLLPSASGIAIYILPIDESLIKQLFPARTSTIATAAQTE